MNDNRHADLSMDEQGRAGLTLPRPVQEHLARELRAAYVEKQERPAYLGDPSLPVMFDEPLWRLETVERNRRRQRARDCGLEAVKTALDSPDPSRD